MTSMGGKLRSAASNGCELELAELLKIASKADIESRLSDFEDWTPLFASVRRNQTRCATLLLKAGADPECVDRSGTTPLSMACSAGNTQLIHALLSHGASINWQNPANGYTVLMESVHHLRPRMVRILLAAGADTEIRDKHHMTALDYASRTSMADLIQEHRGRVWREVVEGAGTSLPVKLAEMCGDFVLTSALKST